MIRQLRLGEAVPSGTPKRYRNSAGYVRLRWRVGTEEYVEVYEHRLVGGLAAQEIHHVNGDKSDNRPENLAAVTPLEHRARHCRIDISDLSALYQAGWSLPMIARHYGINNSSVLRRLKRYGVPLRSISEAATAAWARWRSRQTHDAQ